MKKIIIGLIFLFGFVVFANADYVKRTVVILPVFNQNKNSEEHLRGNIRDSLKVKLFEKDMFNFVSFKDIDKKIAELHFKTEDYVNENKAIDLAVSLGADVAVICEFAVLNDRVILIAYGIDVFARQPTVAASMIGEVGVEVYKYVKMISNDMAKKMAEKFTHFNSNELTNLLKKQSVIIEEDNEEIIAELLNNKRKYRPYDVTRRNKKRTLALPFGRSIVVLVSNKHDVFTVEVNEETYVAKTGVKIILFDNSIGAATVIKVTLNGELLKRITYRQKKNYEVKKIIF